MCELIKFVSLTRILIFDDWNDDKNEINKRSKLLKWLAIFKISKKRLKRSSVVKPFNDFFLKKKYDSIYIYFLIFVCWLEEETPPSFVDAVFLKIRSEKRLHSSRALCLLPPLGALPGNPLCQLQIGDRPVCVSVSVCLADIFSFFTSFFFVNVNGFRVFRFPVRDRRKANIL